MRSRTCGVVNYEHTYVTSDVDSHVLHLLAQAASIAVVSTAVDVPRGSGQQLLRRSDNRLLIYVSQRTDASS